MNYYYTGYSHTINNEVNYGTAKIVFYLRIHNATYRRKKKIGIITDNAFDKIL